MSSPVEIPPEPHRGRSGCVFLVIPTVMIPLVLGGYGLMWGMGIQGRTPTGDRVEMQFSGCEEAKVAVLARVEHMGLGAPSGASTDNGFSITAQLPDDARVAHQIPVSLTERGDLALYYGADRAEQIAGAGDVTQVFHRMTTDASALSVVTLDADLGVEIQKRQMADPEGHLEVWIDGVFIERFENSGAMVSGEIEIEPEPDLAREAIERAASRVVVLANPLPCEIELESTRVITP